jgi:hypothetical protein
VFRLIGHADRTLGDSATANKSAALLLDIAPLGQ